MFKFLVLSLFMLTFLGCSFNNNTQNEGSKFLQGSWLESDVFKNDDLIEYQQHQLKFIRDSFYLVLNKFSKANFTEDTCYKNGKWSEYIKGVYSVTHDNIILKGAYVSKTFRLKKSPCYTSGNFEQTLLYQSGSDSVLVLKSFTNGIMVFKSKL